MCVLGGVRLIGGALQEDQQRLQPFELRVGVGVRAHLVRRRTCGSTAT